MFEVHGGVHTDMSFSQIVPGTFERYGPFETRDEAVNVWRGAMGRNIDNCEHRLFVSPVMSDERREAIERYGQPEQDNHVTRFSDSSLYDEVCVLCGATDASESFDRRCPVN